jgi:hypothetical protein
MFGAARWNFVRNSWAIPLFFRTAIEAEEAFPAELADYAARS